MSRRIRRKKKNKNLVLLAGTALAVIVIFASAAAYAVIAANRAGEQETEGETVGIETDGKDSADLVWNGKSYVYNDHLSNYLLLGIDTREKVETTEGMSDAGQADAIYLVSYDRVKNSAALISIPRDTMTEIGFYSRSGNSIGTGESHISLSYAYGDGQHKSCRMTEEAVSNLLYGIPIQSYCAVSMDGMPVLTESVGSVTVTVPNNSLETMGEQYTAGSQLTLDADSTELFVRYRNTDIPNSALARMERQQEFIRAFSEEAKQQMLSDPGYAADLYLALEPYMITTMGSGEFVKLAQSLLNGQISSEWTVPGEGVQGTYYDEYHVDDEALYEKIIETFYEEEE